MAALSLERVAVAFPIYGSHQRSLKSRLLSATTGGRIGSDSHRVFVQALEDINLDLRRGDRLALIGHNGAGKSTLLRVMAGIYEPVVGRVCIKGRVAPLFDISLGMNPEETGYRNIRLRGRYLGLSTAEILQLIDEVAEFSELGEFLHLPMRTYSDGMRARLAFAISTIMKPEILLLDEAIAAGDARFMDKAEDRIQELVKTSGILVFASHSPDAVRRFCTTGLLLEHGRAIALGPIDEIYQRYGAEPDRESVA